MAKIIFPIGKTDDSMKLFENIVKIIIEYRFKEKYPDTMVNKYAMDILKLVEEYLLTRDVPVVPAKGKIWDGGRNKKPKELDPRAKEIGDNNENS